MNILLNNKILFLEELCLICTIQLVYIWEKARWSGDPITDRNSLFRVAMDKTVYIFYKCLDFGAAIRFGVAMHITIGSQTAACTFSMYSTGDFMKKVPTAICALRDRYIHSLHWPSVHSKYLPLAFTLLINTICLSLNAYLADEGIVFQESSSEKKDNSLQKNLIRS